VDVAVWRIGDVIADLYEVRDEIKTGGMGRVYRVWHRGWSMELAVKVPKPKLVTSPVSMANFETEAQTWVELGLHPNVVSCVYVRRLDGLPRVFAEWVDGGTLAEAVRNRALYQGSPDDALGRMIERRRHRCPRRLSPSSATLASITLAPLTIVNPQSGRRP
jgi:serine/threonine protein kinase